MSSRSRRAAPCALTLGALAFGPIALGAVACKPAATSEERPRFNLAPIDTTRIYPGPTVPRGGVGGPTELAGRNPYEGNPYAIEEGKRLYQWMNCVNCHGQGGGSIGPALWDDEWIYGGSPAAVAESIVRGRPNGMPAFGGRIPEDDVWKIVAYVRALRPGKGSPKAGAK
jgi:cytochrome c oxidase cbb3-type subunit 3